MTRPKVTVAQVVSASEDEVPAALPEREWREYRIGHYLDDGPYGRFLDWIGMSGAFFVTTLRRQTGLPHPGMSW